MEKRWKRRDGVNLAGIPGVAPKNTFNMAGKHTREKFSEGFFRVLDNYLKLILHKIESRGDEKLRFGGSVETSKAILLCPNFPVQFIRC